MQSDGSIPHDPMDPASRIAELGFLANPDLPDRPGPAYLLVALRAAPTLRHYDPETIEYWVTREGRGRRRELTRSTPMPLTEDFSWGMIRIEDRLRIEVEDTGIGIPQDQMQLIFEEFFQVDYSLSRSAGGENPLEAGAPPAAGGAL